MVIFNEKKNLEYRDRSICSGVTGWAKKKERRLAGGGGDMRLTDQFDSTSCLIT